MFEHAALPSDFRVVSILIVPAARVE